MLIRSQDKFKLMQLEKEGTYIEKYSLKESQFYSYSDGITDSEHGFEVVYVIKIESTWMGQYSTMTKAIKVIDMIQEQFLRYICVYGGDYSNDAVFIMPQDSEVNE